MKIDTRLGATTFSAESGLLPFEKRSLPSLPSLPGIYLFLDERGRILFIGSAGRRPGLASRIEALFNSGRWPEVTHFKWAVTPGHDAPRDLVESLVDEFDPPFNRPILELVSA